MSGIQPKFYIKVDAPIIQKILTDLLKQYSRLLARTYWTEGYEQICGAISNEITDYLNRKFYKKYHLQAIPVSGRYIGPGSQYSGGRDGTYHAWVEYWINYKDPSDYKSRNLRIIIDGAFAQFFPKITPLCIRNTVRLMIFFGLEEANDWYIIQHLDAPLDDKWHEWARKHAYEANKELARRKERK